MNLFIQPSMRYKKMDIKNGWERDSLRQENETPDWFERNKWYIVLIGVLLIVSLVYCFPVSAQTITKKYDGVNRIRIDNSNSNELKQCDVFFCGGGFTVQNWSICNTWSSMSVADNHVSCRVGYSTSSPSLAAAERGIKDCANAVKWIKNNWKTYGIDTNKIYLWGTSAGSFCALGVAYEHKIKVAGVINGWGGILNVSYLSNSKVPVYNISTDIDKTVPINCGTSFGVACCGSQTIYNVLTGYGVKTDWLVFEGYNHGLLPKDSGYNLRVAGCYTMAKQFFK